MQIGKIKMKSIARWLATVGLVSSVALTFWFGETLNLKVMALPQEQVEAILEKVWLFGIADREGNPLLFNIENQNNLAGMRVFVSPKDAEKFIVDLKGKQPGIAGKYNKVLPISLDRLFKIAQAQEKEKKEQRLIFNFEPKQAQVNSALSLLQVENRSVQEFKGVPLFYATVTENDKKEYLVTQQGKIPFFFEKETLERELATVRQQKPELAAKVDISVVALENVVANLEKEDNEFLRNVVIVPSAESRQVMRAIQQRQSENNNANSSNKE